MLLPNPSVVPCPCPELSCGLSSSGAGWEEQENLQGSPCPGRALCPAEGLGKSVPCRKGRCQRGVPSLAVTVPVSFAAPCPAGRHPQPRTTKCPLEHPPCPALCVSIHTFPQALPAGNGYPGPDCQFRPVRSHVQHWERIAVAADTSPNVPLLGGCDRECRTIPVAALPQSLCLVPGYPLSPRCWRRAGGRGCSPCPLLLLIPVPCHLPWGWSCLCPSRGTAGLLEALQEGSAVSFGSPRRNCHLWGMSWGSPARHKHFPLH